MVRGLLTSVAMRLSSCSDCNGFVPPRASVCPNCGAKCGAEPRSALSRAAKSVAMLATSTATAMTLMACYGMPPCDDPQDKDGDGAPTCSEDGYDDCDDTNPDIYYGAPDEEGDGVDQNCDGVDGILDETGGAPPEGGSSAGGAPAGGAPAGGAPAGGAPAGGAGGAG
jgi:Putative metal-binding motif